jgi:glc operon protein GlcG
MLERGVRMAEKLGLSEARAIVDAMLAEAEKRGLKFAAAVVDAGGDLIHLARMDGASALNARMSYNKAYTATKWQSDTKAIKERLFDMSLGEERREITWFCDPLDTPVWGGIVLRSKGGRCWAPSEKVVEPPSKMKRSANWVRRFSTGFDPLQHNALPADLRIAPF